MRFIVNVLIALMLLGILTGVMYHRQVEQQQQQLLDTVRDDVRRLSRGIMLQATLRQVDLTEAGYPTTVDPRWFEDDLPQNRLLSGPYPWVEVAHEDQRLLDHPPVKVAVDKSMARFWYNPYNGVVRARVPMAASDAAALRIYNHVNEATLDTLFENDATESLLLR